MRIIEQLVYKITGDNSEFDKSITQSETKVSKFGSVADKMLAGVTVAAIGMVVKKMGDMVISSANALDRVDKLSQKIGLSRVAFQEWDYILGQSGASVEGLQMGIKTLSNAADEAKKGTVQYAEAFDRLGVSVTDANGEMKDQETLFAEVFSALADVENQTERTAIANKLLRSSATELAPAINTSKEGIEQLRKEAHDLGLVYSDELVDAGVALGDNIDRLKKSFDALKTNALAPIIGLAVTFTNKLFAQKTATSEMAGVLEIIKTKTAEYKEISDQLVNTQNNLSDAERNLLLARKETLAFEIQKQLASLASSYNKTKDNITTLKGEINNLNELFDGQNAYLKTLTVGTTEYDNAQKALGRIYGELIGKQQELSNAQISYNGLITEASKLVADGVLDIEKLADVNGELYNKIMAGADAITKERKAIEDRQKAIELAQKAFAAYGDANEETLNRIIKKAEEHEDSAYWAELNRLATEKLNEVIIANGAETDKVDKILANHAQRMQAISSYSLALGDSYDENSEKASQLTSTIKALIDTGLTAEDEAVASLIAQLGALQTATEEVTDATKIAYDKIAESRMSDKEKALKAIQEQADAFLKAGVSDVEVSKWQSEQIAKYEEEETKKLEREEEARKKVRDNAYAEIERSRMDEYQLAVDNIEKQTQAYITAGVLEVDAEKWKNEEIAKLQEAQTEKAIEEAEKVKQAWEDATWSMLGSVTSIWGSINQVQANQNEEELNRIRSRQKEELSILTDKKDTELALLKEKLDNGIIAEEAYEKAKEQIDAEYTASKDAQEAELNAIKSKYAKEEADRNKALSTLSVILDTAKAIMQIWANPLIAPWGKGVWTGLATAAGAAQISAINSAPVPSYDVGSIRIPETTQAVVHKDEMILTAPQAEQARREGITIAPTNATSGRIPIQNVIYLDGKQISEAVVQYLNSGSVGTIKARVVK